MRTVLGGPRPVTPDQAGAVIVAALEATPEDAAHWSRRSMAKRSGLSRSTIGRIWRDFGLRPHLADGFQAVGGPAVRGESGGRRRSLPQPPGEGGGAVRG
jgi:hypothetical protein